MRTLLTLLVFACTNATCAASWFNNIDLAGFDSSTFQAQGVAVNLKTLPNLADERYIEELVVTLYAPEFESTPLTVQTLEQLGNSPLSLGIGKLNAADPMPSVLIQTYTGGNHCCWLLTALVPVGQDLQKVEVGWWNGGGLDTFPSDLDDDGTIDFVLNDQAFLYQFGSYADSATPPRFFNIQNGQLVEVSDRPTFALFFENYSHQTLRACRSGSGPERNGACAAWVASEARLGRLAAALERVDTLAWQGPEAVLPQDCKVNYQITCPQNQKITFDNFSSAIRWFLRKHGYAP